MAQFYLDTGTVWLKLRQEHMTEGASNGARVSLQSMTLFEKPLNGC